MSILTNFDPEVADAIRLETERQEYNLELIASEALAHPAATPEQMDARSKPRATASND